MSLALAVKKYSPAVNPDRVILGVTFGGVYTQNSGDALNVTPNTWTDPGALGVVGPNCFNAPLPVTPSVYNENVGGYYFQVVKGTTLANYGLRCFQPGGAELAAGAYPAAVLNGEVEIEVLF